MTKHFFFTDTLGAGGISTNVVALSSYVATQGERPVIVPVSTRESRKVMDGLLQLRVNPMALAVDCQVSTIVENIRSEAS